jgi:hypothetical protein
MISDCRLQIAELRLKDHQQSAVFHSEFCDLQSGDG